MSEQTEIPRETLEIATDESAFKQGWATVLGTLVGPEGGRALVRFSSGRVETVAPGAKMGRGTVVAVEDGALIFALNGETRRMPVAGD